MNIPGQRHRLRRLCLFFFLLVIPAVPSLGRPTHSDTWAREKFAAAERMREALNGRPPSDRTRRDYQRVIDAYRRVYYGSPTSSKADPSAVNVAELLVEMGRRFDDDKVLRSAIGQYKFLRREYPGSKYRFAALFTIGEVYKDDLDDAAQARSAFGEFLRQYPRNRLADDARAAIAELDKPAEEKTGKESPKKTVSTKAAEDEETETAAAEQTSSDSPPASSSGKMPRVTGVRHWSTPDSTRVTIDLEQDVKFESQRIDHPDRIYFDLLATQLASTLVGKTFEVEDGFLKKVRVAQFQPDRTRVVLEVDDLAEYNAFLLPNPCRLIIDIHGKRSAKAIEASAEAAGSAKPSKREGVKAADDSKDESEGDGLTEPLPVAKKTKPAPGPNGTPVKTVAANRVPRKVVEADDEDTDQAPAISSAKAVGVKGPGKKETPLKSASDKASTATEVAIRTRGKLKSADGNDDEVATLDPLDFRPEVSPPTAKSAKATTHLKASRGKERHAVKQAPPGIEVREARPTLSGDRSLIRALGLKIGRIVIDPGHGGHDAGTIGPNGLQEKDLVLDVGRRLGKLLEGRLGADVVYTRQDDVFIPLETRTAIANQEQADLFVSIHANSSSDPDARGVETYYLNFTSNANALEVAARENAVSDKSIHELQDLVKKIALKEKIEESREFATNVQHSLHSGLAVKSPGLRDRGVKKAPFIVLIGANMPSILAEISFVSNPGDERKLETAEYRQRIAESLYKGISKYASGLSGVKVASRMGKSEGQ